MTAGTPLADHADRLAAQAGEVARCLDFDGTLAPIVDDPAGARPLAGVVDLLEPLAGRFAAVALISGRPAGYLAEHAACGCPELGRAMRPACIRGAAHRGGRSGRPGWVGLGAGRVPAAAGQLGRERGADDDR